MDNDLRKFARSGDHHHIDKWDDYFDVYDKHFKHLRGQTVNILEIGVSHGGSLEMWLNYFGKDNCRVYGIDLEPRSKQIENKPYITVFTGDQGDPNFLKSVIAQTSPFDIIIDDGSHIPRHQIASFKELYPHLKPDGIYLCEDLHTNYVPMYGGGLRRPDTFVEFIKDYIDKLNFMHIQGYKPDYACRNTYSLHFYDSIAVIQRTSRERTRGMDRVQVGPGLWK